MGRRVEYHHPLIFIDLIMIKEYNLEPVQNILSKIEQTSKHLLYLQLFALMLTATFFTLQATLNQVAYNIYLSALWLAIEAILLLLWMRMRSRYKDMDIRIISYEGKQMGYYRLEWCLILRFCKFMCAFFNFLGIVYAVKSMRHLKLIDWTTILCLIGFGFALHWLTMINFVISLFKKCLAIYDNFQMVLQQEQSKAQEML